MNRVEKLRLLNDMGIDVWQLRSPAGNRSEPAQAPAAAAQPSSVVTQPQVATGRKSERRTRSVAAETAGNSTAADSAATTDSVPTRDSAATSASVDSADSAACAERVVAPVAAVNTAGEDPAIEPFSVLCFSQGGIMVMLQVADAREVGRFARDLLAGACGNWRSAEHGVLQDVHEAVFRWPPAGLSSTEVEAVKALRAFTDKQLSQDRRKTLIVLSQSVADRLDGMALPQSLVLLPPVAELSGNWELKRDLWLELQTYAI